MFGEINDMDGVTILNQYEVILDKDFSWSACWFVVGIVFVVSVIASFLSCLADNDLSWQFLLFTAVISTVILGGLLGSLAGYTRGEPTSIVTEYQVIVADDVSMSDFTSKYEIIDQEGLIYTVRERQ